MAKPITVYDLAAALDVSTGTVHRALRNGMGINPSTKKRVLRMAKTMGYRPNLAARYLSQKRRTKISVNTLQGTTSFWDEVRAGIEEEAKAQGAENVELEFRTFPSLGRGDEEAFDAAIQSDADGVITFPSRPRGLRAWIRRASRSKVPVVCVATDAPASGRVAVVSVDTHVSGSLAADLLGRFLHGQGTVAVTLSELEISEHLEKYQAFSDTLKRLYPAMSVVAPIEDHDVEAEAYTKSKILFAAYPDLSGIYITTEASMPVIQAARDMNVLSKLTIIATDLFPALIEEIRNGSVAAAIFQRPRTQGRMAYRLLHEFLAEGACSTHQLTLSPHLVTRGNLEFFLRAQSSAPDSILSPPLPDSQRAARSASSWSAPERQQPRSAGARSGS
jgi:LacI family transcriptional regulator, galactose operon repressor